MTKENTRLPKRKVSLGLQWPGQSGSKFFLLSMKYELWLLKQGVKKMAPSYYWVPSASHCPSKTDNIKILSMLLK